MNKWLDLVALVIVHLGLIPAVLYPIVWGWRGTWRTNRVGRALMWHAMAMGALFAVSVAGFWLPYVWLNYYAYTAVLAAVGVTLYWQLWTLIREQRGNRVPD